MMEYRQLMTPVPVVNRMVEVIVSILHLANEGMVIDSFIWIV